MQSGSVLEHRWERPFLSFRASIFLPCMLKSGVGPEIFPYRTPGSPHSLGWAYLPIWEYFPPSGIDVFFFVMLKGMHHVTLSHAPSFLNFRPHGGGSRTPLLAEDECMKTITLSLWEETHRLWGA